MIILLCLPFECLQDIYHNFSFLHHIATDIKMTSTKKLKEKNVLLVLLLQIMCFLQRITINFSEMTIM